MHAAFYGRILYHSPTAYDDNAVVHGHGRRLDIQNMHDACLLHLEDGKIEIDFFNISTLSICDCLDN